MYAQADLFGAPPPLGATPPPGDEVAALVRDRLRATLSPVNGAEAMPWGGGHLAVIREDDDFRFGEDLLPPGEAASLWAEFNAEMGRFYAIMNAGKEPASGD